MNSSSTPKISAIVTNRNNNYSLVGSALNGASQGATYGDDAEMDTNYPIVSVATDIGTTYYARTTNWNQTGVGTTNGSTVTSFSLPGSISAAPSVKAVAQSPVVGVPLNNVTVATFTDPNGENTGDYSATINWGDGTQTAGVISGPNSSGVYSVAGTHIYTKPGSVTLSVTVVDLYASGNLSVSASGVSSTAVAFTLSGVGATNFTVKSARLAAALPSSGDLALGILPDATALESSGSSSLWPTTSTAGVTAGPSTTGNGRGPRRI